MNDSSHSPSPASASRRQRQRGRGPVRRSSRWIWIISLLLGGAILALSALFFIQGRSETIAGLMLFPDVEQGHQEGALTYEQTPPAGGIHNAAWQNCGIYDQPIQAENAVHSLEHGAVWVTYRPDLSAADVEAVRNHVQGQSYVLLSPYDGLPVPVVASAWGAQVQLDGPNDPRLRQFLTQYRQGPQTPEPGAACIRGLGQPVPR